MGKYMIFADVIVDISVKSLDRPFQYIVPEEMHEDAVIGAMVISTVFSVVPVLNKVSSGFVIIITTLIVAGLAAHFCPIPEEREAES